MNDTDNDLQDARDGRNNNDGSNGNNNSSRGHHYHHYNDNSNAKNSPFHVEKKGHNVTEIATDITDKIASEIVPRRHAYSRKGQNGKVLVVGGSYIYHGAPILSSLAAMRFGSDLVYTAVPKHNVSATRSASPDLIVIPMADAKLTRGSATKLVGMTPVGIDSVAIGMGLAIQERGALLRLVKSYTNADARMVLDASALVPEVLPAIENTNSIITPHAGEFKHVFGDDAPTQSDMGSRIRMVQDKARKHKITIILKGATDIISDGDASYLCSAGTPGMTTGGTGDVMTGLAAGALAAIRNPLDAAVLAAYTNGRAGEIISDSVGYHMMASDMLDAIPEVLCRFDSVCDCPDASHYTTITNNSANTTTQTNGNKSSLDVLDHADEFQKGAVHS